MDTQIWKSDLERYERGSPLGMLCFDSKVLWDAGGAFIPTFAWILSSEGYLFDTIWTFYRSVPVYSDRFFENATMEHLLRIENYFDTHWFCLGREVPSYLYPVPSDKITTFDSYIELYRYLLKNCKGIPEEAVIVPVKHPWDGGGFIKNIPDRSVFRKEKVFRFLGDLPEQLWDIPEETPVLFGHPLSGRQECDPSFPPGFYGRLHLYAWPEIYYRKCLAFMDDVAPEVLKEFGINKVLTWMTSSDKWKEAGFSVEEIDNVHKGDRPYDLTERILLRWEEKAQGICYGILSNEQTTPGYLGMMIRCGYFPLYDPDWQRYIPKAVAWAKKLGNPRILGTGDNWKHGIWDMMVLCGGIRRKVPNNSCVPSIVRGIRERTPLPFYLPWECGYTDGELERFAMENRIGVTNLWGTMEIPYTSILPHILDTHLTFRARAGIECTLQWIEFLPHQYQKIYTTTYGKFIEPMLHDFVAGKAFPDDCLGKHLTKDDLWQCLRLFKEGIKEFLGEEYMPKGYMALRHEGLGMLYRIKLQRYENNSIKTIPIQEWLSCWTEEEFQERREHLLKEKAEVLRDFGILYYFGAGDYWEDGDFTHMPVIVIDNESPLDILKKLEKEHTGPCAVAFNYDTGMSFMMAPGLFNAACAEDIRKRYPAGIYSSFDIVARTSLMYYIACGGESKRLIPMKPCEFVRYRRLIERLRSNKKMAGKDVKPN